MPDQPSTPEAYADLDYDLDLARFCDWCDRELDPADLTNDEGECYRCAGLDRCSDDMCHGTGRCMHRA